MAAYPPRPSASLYVGNLHPDVTEANLFELFNPVGPVASIRVCRDNATRRSLGYAYVNFHQMVDAERALDNLNYYLLKDRPCRIMWSQRDPALRKSGLGNVFIKNLERSIDNKSLHDTFSAFGNILSCKVMTDDNGESRGFGFVHFENSDSAQKAIEKVNGMLLNDKQVYVGLHIPRRDRSSKYDLQKKNFTNVFVKNLDESITTDQLHKDFSEFGKITSAVVQADSDGKSRCFGFVNFETHEEAARACDELNEKEVNGKKLYVGRAQKKEERKQELRQKFELIKQEKSSKLEGVNLYIKYLDDNVTNEMLRTAFAPFGTITSAKVQMSEMEKDKYPPKSDEKEKIQVSRGFGFVCFSSREEATKALTEMNGKILEGGKKPIYVAFAQKKEVRRQQLEMQNVQRAQMRLAHQSGVLTSPYPPVYYNFPGGMPGQQPPFVYPMMQPTHRRYPPDVLSYNNVPRNTRTAGGMGQARPPRSNNNAPSSSPQRFQGNNGMPSNQASLPNQSRSQVGAQTKFKLTTNARNVDTVPHQTGNSGQNMYPPQEPALNPASLANASFEEQKQLLGERIYPHVFGKYPGLAGKITGMLLDIDNAELLHLLENTQDLNQKIEEAVGVLKAHGEDAQ